MSFIYWSAFVPREGVSLMGECPPSYVALFEQLSASAPDRSVMLPLPVWQQAFMQDAGEEAQRLIHGLLRPQPIHSFTETVKPLDPKAFPGRLRYVLSRDDIALPPGEFGWKRMVARLGIEVEQGPGSHEALFTPPAELAAVLAR